MKVLPLIYPDDVASYELLYEALYLSPNHTGRQVLVVSKIFDKLDAIGIMKDGEEGKLGLRTLAYSYDLNLEDTEFEVLYNAFMNTPWTGSGARKAAKLLTRLDALNRGETLSDRKTVELGSENQA